MEYIQVTHLLTYSQSWIHPLGQGSRLFRQSKDVQKHNLSIIAITCIMAITVSRAIAAITAITDIRTITGSTGITANYSQYNNYCQLRNFCHYSYQIHSNYFDHYSQCSYYSFYGHYSSIHNCNYCQTINLEKLLDGAAITHSTYGYYSHCCN